MLFQLRFYSFTFFLFLFCLWMPNCFNTTCHLFKRLFVFHWINCLCIIVFIRRADLCGCISGVSVLSHWSLCLSFGQNYTGLITAAI
jgi:hypothetical protein